MLVVFQVPRVDAKKSLQNVLKFISYALPIL